MDSKIGYGTPTPGCIVTMHTRAGDCPAMVTGVNPDDTLSLTLFLPGEIAYRVSVQQVKPDMEDEEDKIGYWEWPDRVEG